jgi:hypothetical protein
MTELELRQIFKNLSDCYADTGRFENDGSYTEGEVIQAMTEDRFIEALKEAKLLPIPDVVVRSEQLPCNCGVRLEETTLQVYCPKCWRTWKTKQGN